MTQFYLGRSLHHLADQWPSAARVLRGLDVRALHLATGLAGTARVELASAVGDAIGRRLGPRLRQQKHVLRNLRIAFPEREDAWIQTTARAIWGRIFRTLAEYPHLTAIAGAGEDSRVEVVSQFDLGPARAGEQRMLLAGIHQANWNVHGVVGRIAGLPLSVIYGSQRNSRLEAIVAGYRNRMPCEFIHVDAGARGILASLNEGRHIGTFVDARRDDYPMVPFFGHPTQTTLVPARLAIKFGLALVPVRLERLPKVRFRATFHPLLAPDPGIADPRDAALELTARLNAVFEQWIRACPEDWICAKRRWPREI
jgi:KDO2-lipid IV(A) lauroyltransferase